MRETRARLRSLSLRPLVHSGSDVLETDLLKDALLRVTHLAVEEWQGVSGVRTTHQPAQRVNAELSSSLKRPREVVELENLLDLDVETRV